MLPLNAEILSWARETAGLSPQDAVKKLALGDARGVSAVDRLQALESGESLPTRAMLSKMARQYRRPLLTFYLDQPPPRGDWGRDFRAPLAGRSRKDEALLNALVRNVQARQGLLREAMLDDDDELAPLSLVGSVTTDTPVARMVATMRDALEVQLSDFRAAATPDEAFRLLRSHAAQAGIFVLVLGNLGSHHTDLGVDVFRGFALTDDFVPFVVVNPKDSAPARSFTLVHELAHLWLGAPGISGGDPMDPVEVFCNRIASTFLLSDRELATLRRPVSDGVEPWATAIAEFAKPLNISSSMVAYRLHLQNVIDLDTWRGVSHLFHSRWLASLRRQGQARQGNQGGPTYPIRIRHGLGPGLVELAGRLASSGALTATKAARILGVSPRNAHAILDGQ